MSTGKIFGRTVQNAAVLFLLSLLFTGCGPGKEILSSWPEKEIKLSGELSEFGTAVQQVPDKNFFLGFKNDDKFLYLCLATEDRSKIFQMMRGGFIVWFEPENGDSKTFGIKYPLANSLSGEQQLGEGGRGGNREANQEGEGAVNAPFEKLLESQKELEVVNNDKYPLLAMPLENKEGIKVRIGIERGKYIYELRVPLAVSGDYSFTAGAKPGDKIRVRLETQQVNIEKESGEEGGSRSGGGTPGGIGMGGGRGGGRRGGGGMRPGGGRSGSSDPINYSAEVRLTSQAQKK